MAAKAHGLSSDGGPATTDTSINETETGIVPTEGDTDAHSAPITDVGSVGGVTTAGQNDLFRHFALVWLAVNLIDAAPRRVRRALKGQEEAVLKAVKRYGFRIPILVKSKPGGKRYEVIDGHMRLVAANRLAADTAPCIIVDDLSDVETRRLALSLNRLQEAGEWDPDALRLEINEIIEISNDVRIPGFELPEIEAIRFGGEEAAEADPADDITDHLGGSDATVTRPGDTWCLGDHLIHCGSARDATALAALLVFARGLKTFAHILR